MALVTGQAMVDRIVHPILAVGHDVQLHAHGEWTSWARLGPLQQIALDILMAV